MNLFFNNKNKLIKKYNGYFCPHCSYLISTKINKNITKCPKCGKKINWDTDNNSKQ